MLFWVDNAVAAAINNESKDEFIKIVIEIWILTIRPGRDVQKGYMGNIIKY